MTDEEECGLSESDLMLLEPSSRDGVDLQDAKLSSVRTAGMLPGLYPACSYALAAVFHSQRKISDSAMSKEMEQKVFVARHQRQAL